MVEGRGSVRARRRTLGVVALVVSLAAAACNPVQVDKVGDTPETEIRALLRRRAAMLAGGDVEGYLAAVDPSARAAEAVLADGAASVPVSWANASFHPRPGARSTPTSFRDAEVELVFRYEGLPDDNLFRFSLEYDLDRRSGSWAVTRSEVAEGSDPLPIWASGPVAHLRTEHFLALHRPGLPRAEEAVAAAEEGRRGLAGRLGGLDADAVHLVLLAGSDEEYAAFKGSPDEGEVAVARTVFRRLSRPEARHMLVKAHQIVLGDATAASEDGAQAPATEVFQHELAHLALTGLDSPVTPSWVIEGAAMYLAEERRVGSWAFGQAEGVFAAMSVGRMAGGGLLDGLQYAYANAAVLHLVDEFGAERFFEFYARFRPLSPSGAFLQDPTGVTLGDVYDLTTEQLDERTRAYIARAAGAG